MKSKRDKAGWANGTAQAPFIAATLAAVSQAGRLVQRRFPRVRRRMDELLAETKAQLMKEV